MDIRLHHGGVHPGPAALRPSLRDGQFDEPLVQRAHALLAHHCGQPDQRLRVRHAPQIDPRHPPVDQAPPPFALGLLKAPALHPLEHQQPQRHVGRRPPPPAPAALRPSVGLPLQDGVHQSLIIQHGIEPPQGLLQQHPSPSRAG